MSNLVTYQQNLPSTLSSTQKIGRFAFVACALTLGADLVMTDASSEINTAVSKKVLLVDIFKYKSHTNIGSQFVMDQSEFIPKNGLKFVDQQIDKFMVSLKNGEDIQYSRDLIDLAEQVLKNNPGAFKNFI